MKFSNIIKFAFFILIVFFICFYIAFSAKKPWINLPLSNKSLTTNVGLGTKILGEYTENFSTVVVLTFSGGGTRAAAFAYGVMEGLRDSPVKGEKQDNSLLDEVELVSGVSGGSILAAYYVAFGSKTFSSFKDKFLYTDFQKDFFKDFIKPRSLFELMSPWYGRGNLLADHFHELFEQKTFGDLPGRPRLLISATDLSKSRPFPFTAEQFSLICSDLSSVPLAYAVSASSSVPVVFSPIVLKNYNFTNECSKKTSIRPVEAKKNSFNTTGIYQDKSSYLISQDRKYIHLVDGAVVDNLGLLSLLNQSKSESIISLVDAAPPNSIKRLVFIVVNSETDTVSEIDGTQTIPNVGQVVNAIRKSKGNQATTELTQLLKSSIPEWQKEIRQRGNISPFANDAKLHLVSVNLLDIPDPTIRNKLSKVPTALELPNDVIDELIAAGRQTLFSSPAYISLMADFK
jgi:NTE family protein